METIQIQKRGAVGFSSVSLKDFYGALRSGYVNSVEDIIQINGESYYLSTATSLYGAAGSAVGAAQPVEIDYRTGGNKRVVLLTTNALGGAFTLGDGNMIGPLDNREITFILVTKVVNNAIITPTNIVGAANITLTEEGQTVTLLYNEIVGAWTVKALFNSTSTDTFAREYIERGILVKAGGLVVSTNDTALIDINLASNTIISQLILLELLNVSGSIIVDGCLRLTVINLPVLTLAPGAIQIASNPMLVAVNLQSLENILSIEIYENNILETLDLSALLTIVSFLTINNNALLEIVDLSSLTSGINLDITANPLLTSITLGNGYTGLAINFTVNALTQVSIDDILSKIDIAGQLNGAIDLSGGTNSVPSAAGLISKANLVIKGWGVIHN